MEEKDLYKILGITRKVNFHGKIEDVLIAAVFIYENNPHCNCCLYIQVGNFKMIEYRDISEQSFYEIRSFFGDDE